MRTVGTPHASGPPIDIKIARDIVDAMVALRACEFKRSRHGTSGSAGKATDYVRVRACLEMSRGMLLERAVGADQARPRCELGRLKKLNREPKRRPRVGNRTI